MHSAISHAEPTNDYELIQRVGVGSFGEVYKARHVRNGGLAAVKLVKVEAGENFNVFQQEILMLRDCVHPNIISYYSSYIKRDKLWIVMEYCSGGSLQDIYQLSGPLLELQIAFVCRETLKGLSYLHHRGLVHRDIKGANILLTETGDVKLADFGVAAQITATLGKRKSFIGTPYWMAPEVASVERLGGYGVECDIWAVGITSIELAELQPPFFQLQPMQVLYLMTKSSYKPPRLKDKHKWSKSMYDFVKLCLTKNPKKRPTPDKLLASHPFVKGALSARLTRELLDKINNLGRPTPRDSPEEGEDAGIGHPVMAQPHFYQNERSPGDENVDVTQIASMERRESGVSSGDSDDGDLGSGHEAGTLTTMRLCPSKSSPNGFSPPPITSPTPSTSISINVESEASVASEPVQTGAKPKHRFRLENAFFRFPAAARLRHKLPGPASNSTPELCRSATVTGVPTEDGEVRLRSPPESAPVSERPTTFFGLPRTPKVSMGACFFSVFHGTELTIHCAATWVHPANSHQYAILGAEEGIFMLDLYELHDTDLVQIYPSKCAWLYVIDNVMMSLQGKVPYLYRHDLLQLVQQEMLTQKISKRMTKVPEALKPKMFMATVRLPETKDCQRCVVRQSVFNDTLYLACAVPDAMLLYQWYAPQLKFVLLKRCELARISRAPPPTFDLVFRSGQATSDYPQLCIGVYKRPDDGFDLNLVNFNDHGRLEDFLSNGRSSDVFADLIDTGTMTSRKLKFDASRVVKTATLQQLERDALILAYDHRVVLISLTGDLKKSDVMATDFTFDFDVSHALALPDSVLAFHKHGVEGRSFFNGSITQDLNDPSKIFCVLSSDPMVILKSRTIPVEDDSSESTESDPSPAAETTSENGNFSRATTIVYDTLNRDSTLSTGGGDSLTLTLGQRPFSSPGATLTLTPSTKDARATHDLCILMGHVSTMADDE